MGRWGLTPAAAVARATTLGTTLILSCMYVPTYARVENVIGLINNVCCVNVVFVAPLESCLAWYVQL